MRLKLVFALVFAFIAVHAEAACKPTARMWTYGYPGAASIFHGNNLIKPAGKAIEASGQKLIIRGKLLDANCVPVTQAVVEIWQLDPYGKRARPAAKDLAGVEPVFTGSGRTYTGTDGEFYFITAFPGAAKGQAPRIQLMARPEKMRSFSTQMLLGNDTRNTSDRGLRGVRPATREGVTLRMSPLERQYGRGYYGDITITLPDKTPFDRY